MNEIIINWITTKKATTKGRPWGLIGSQRDAQEMVCGSNKIMAPPRELKKLSIS